MDTAADCFLLRMCLFFGFSPKHLLAFPREEVLGCPAMTGAEGDVASCPAMYHLPALSLFPWEKNQSLPWNMAWGCFFLPNESEPAQFCCKIFSCFSWDTL